MRSRVLKGSASVLRKRRDAFARCLAGKMLIYAIGSGLDRSDRPALDRIVDRLRRDDYRFSALVLAVVESRPFREPAPIGDRP